MNRYLQKNKDTTHLIESLRGDFIECDITVIKLTLEDNYTKILLEYKYFEFMNMLFYRYPLEKKGLKTKKKKSIKKRKSKKSI